MKKMLAAALLLVAALALAPAADAAPFGKLTVDASQSYLRLGMNDTIVVTVHLLDGDGVPSLTADVPIAVDFVSGGEYATFESSLIVTNDTGQGSAVLRLKPDNPPESWKLPLPIMVKAYAIDNPGVSGNVMVYITSTGPIWGYVVDDFGSTITGARVTVTMPDGKLFPGNFVSSSGAGAPMGQYRIDNLPVELYGHYTLTATKNGYTGTRPSVDAGSENVRTDITISGYHDTVNVPSIINGNSNATATPTAVPGNESEPPTRPTTMTTTILIAIVLITLVYIGLKVYRRMF